MGVKMIMFLAQVGPCGYWADNNVKAVKYTRVNA